MFSDITIRPFEPADQTVAKNLILAGLAEHLGELDLSKNPDLNDIASTYVNGVFLVAQAGDEIVGTGALIPYSDGVAEIVRMSVSIKMRRMHIGTLILRHLITYAQNKGCWKIVLETTEDWRDAIEFYLNNNFCITHYSDGNVYFVLDFVGKENI